MRGADRSPGRSPSQSIVRLAVVNNGSMATFSTPPPAIVSWDENIRKGWISVRVDDVVGEAMAG